MESFRNGSGKVPDLEQTKTKYESNIVDIIMDIYQSYGLMKPTYSLWGDFLFGESPNIDLELKLPSIDQFMEHKEGYWLEVEGRDNIAVENTFDTHNEGWEQGVAIRTHEHVVVHYKSGLVEIFYDNPEETKDDGSFLIQCNEHYFRGVQKPAEQTSPFEVLTATTAADNSTVSSSGS